MRGIVGQLAVLSADTPPHRSGTERCYQLRMRRAASHLLCCAKEAKRFPAAAGTKGDKNDMAIYHMEAKVIPRGAGRTACGAAAYMSCSEIYNEYDVRP